VATVDTIECKECKRGVTVDVEKVKDVKAFICRDCLQKRQDG
jgi:hypothetical protein